MGLGFRHVAQAVIEPCAQILQIEVLSDQDETIGTAVRAIVHFKRETSTYEVKDVTLVGLREPQEALSAKQPHRPAAVEEGLELLDTEWPLA